MTKRLPFTQLSVQRLIAAAHRMGLRVVEIRPDGTLITAPREPLPDTTKCRIEEDDEDAAYWTQVPPSD